MLEKIKIAFVGDIVPGGVLTGKSKDYISDDLISYFKNFDLRVGTLEAPFGNNYSFDSYKIDSKVYDIVYSQDKDFEKIKHLNMNVVSLANNHIFDLGVKGFQNTVEKLEECNINFCGAGINIDEASKPAVIELNKKKIAFFAYCKPYGWSSHLRIAGESTPGINPLIESKVIEDVKRYRKQYDLIYLLFHWGNEHTYYPSNNDIKLAKSIIDKGADGIIGSHSHRVQPCVKYKGKYIFFSLGNFLFPDRYINSPRVTYYPLAEDDVSKYPVSDDFSKVKEPTLKVWKEESRYGAIASHQVDLENMLHTANYKYTYLDNRNKLIKANDRTIYSTKLLLRYISLFILLPSIFYRAIYFLKRAINYINRIFK